MVTVACLATAYKFSSQAINTILTRPLSSYRRGFCRHTSHQAEKTMATIARLAKTYAFRPQATNTTFEDVGYGPLVVERQDLCNEIIQKANPKRSFHISGCKASGKTTLLNQIAQQLVNKGKTVFFFNSASEFHRSDVNDWIRQMAEQKLNAYILVDETQANANSGVFTMLLKNNKNHCLTTIGAGVPEFQTVSGVFKKKITTDRLFVTEDMLSGENILAFFAGTSSGATRDEIRKLLQYIRSHVGGHIYPLMWLAEHLVPLIKNQGYSLNDVIKHYESNEFRSLETFQEMVQRVLPDVLATDIRPLLYRRPDARARLDLQRKGFCDSGGRIISTFLFDNFVSFQQGVGPSLVGELNRRVAGVQQLLCCALPKVTWDDYTAHGGPVEDALTFELLLILSEVLETRLFNPKLINAGTASRKPDLYLNSIVDAYVECVLTAGNNLTERKKLDEHISRFYPNGEDLYYNIGDSDFAVINYQQEGGEPMQPSDQRFKGQIFEERVFTFIMSTKAVYRGTKLLT